MTRNEAATVEQDSLIPEPKDDEGLLAYMHRVFGQMRRKGAFDPQSNAWRALQSVGLDPRSLRDVYQPADFQALWTLAEIEEEAARKSKKLRRKASTRSFLGGLLSISAAVLSAIAGLGTLNALIGSTAATWLSLVSAAVAAASTIVQGFARATI
jgi:hypothetical protein